MTTKQDFVLEACRRQCDAALQALEILAEGAIRVREAQLEAATEAHADLEATRKALAGASDARHFLSLYAQWARANGQKSLAYWRSISQAAMETHSALVQCACGVRPPERLPA